MIRLHRLAALGALLLVADAGSACHKSAAATAPIATMPRSIR